MVDYGRTLGEVAAVTRVRPELSPKFVEFFGGHSHVNDTTTNTIFGGNSGAARVTAAISSKLRPRSVISALIYQISPVPLP